MSSFGVGAVLKQERLRQDLSLSDIAGLTRISERYLAAIEQDKFECLPGILFARNFVRQYASALKVDPAPMLAELPKVDLASIPLPDPPARVRRSTWDPRWTSPIASMAWLVVAAGAAFAAYAHFNHLVFPAPPAEIQSAPSRSASAPAQVEDSGPGGPATGPSNADTEGARPDPAIAAPVAQASLTPDQEQSAAEADRPIQVVLTASAPAWVEVVADGKTAFSGTLQPNDSRSIAADALVKLVTGNAGGIGISLNGRTLEPIGTSGEVRTVKLTAEGLQSVEKTPPPAPDPL